MSRPFYETEEDRSKEFAVAKSLATLWGYTAIKLKPACEIDYVLTLFDDIKGVMEIKCRNYSYEQLDKLGGYMLSCHKMSALRRWHADFPIGVAIAIQLTDGIFVFTVSHASAFERFPKIKMAGRRDRGDAQDIEPCVLIPMQKFRKILDAETIPTKVA
jgi:hypothetical protein